MAIVRGTNDFRLSKVRVVTLAGVLYMIFVALSACLRTA